MPAQIFTIGHSTHTLDIFTAMLKSFDIQLLTDIRSYPGSRNYPHFNKESLQFSLPEAGVEYVHLKSLGGRRKAIKDSLNTAWQHEAFRGYADYMETPEFNSAVGELISLASEKNTAYMCSESLWWRCHRSLVSDYLLSLGWEVNHIMGISKSTPHTYTKPARIDNGKLTYHSLL